MTHARNDGNTAAKDEARTPPELYCKIDKRFEFILDAACNRENCLCFRGFFHDDNIDALKEDWNKASDGKAIWCNPPYSNPAPFIKKSYEESMKGCIVVMLLPSDTSTRAFHEYCMNASEIIFLYPRVVFNRPDGTPMKGSPKFGSAIVVFSQIEFDGSPVISSMSWK